MKGSTGSLILAGILAGAVVSGAPQAPTQIEPDSVVMTARPYNPFPPVVPTFRSSSSIVAIEAVVRDGDGVAVAGLTAADFTLRENGEERVISGFSVEDSRPGGGAQPAPVSAGDAVPAAGNARVDERWVAFFVDDVNATPPFLARAQQALSAWCRNPWPRGAKAAIFTASGHESLAFTSDQVAFQRVAAALVYFPIWPDFRTQVTLDALRAVVGIVAREPGERRIIMIGNGYPIRASGGNARAAVEFNDTTGQERVIGAAVHAGVAIDALDVSGVGKVGALNPRLDSVTEIADKTGGRLLTNNNNFAAGLARLARGPEVVYTLSFVPRKVEADGKFHHLAVGLKRPGHFEIEAREGYYAPDQPGQASEFDGLQGKIDQEAMGAARSKQLDVQLTPQPGKLANGSSGVHIVAEVHMHGLPFQDYGAYSIEQLSFAAVLTDAAGHYVTGEEGNINLRLNAAIKKQYESKGFKTGMTLEAAPGTYTLREVVQESVKGEMTTITQTVVIPPG